MYKTWWQTVDSWEEADIVMFSIPYDATASFQKGTRDAPKEFRNNLEFAAETWSPYFNKELKELKIFDAGDVQININMSPDEVMEASYQFTKKYISKKIMMIGGEHSITFPVVKALHTKYKNLNLIQFDAHTDLRNEFYGEKNSHACVMKRCIDILGKGKTFQFGIRSGIKEEFELANKGITYIEKSNINTLGNIIEKIKNKPVYVTVDIDVFDPSLIPGTGTPEGGGINFMQMIDALSKLRKIKKIVGFDIVELAPGLDYSKRSTAITIQLAREMLLSLLAK